MKTSSKTTKAKLVSDSIGGLKLTVDGKKIQNLFVKEAKRVNGKVMELEVKMIYLIKEDKKNW